MRVPKHTESLLNVDEHRAHTEVALMAILKSNGISIRERHEAAWFCRCLRVATEQPQKLEELGNTLCDLIRNGETPEVAHSRLRDIESGAGNAQPPLYSIYVSNPAKVKANIDAWKAGKTALKLKSGVCYEDMLPYPENHVVVDANEAKRQLLEENKVLAAAWTDGGTWSENSLRVSEAYRLRLGITPEKTAPYPADAEVLAECQRRGFCVYRATNGVENRDYWLIDGTLRAFDGNGCQKGCDDAAFADAYQTAKAICRERGWFDRVPNQKEFKNYPPGRINIGMAIGPVERKPECDIKATGTGTVKYRGCEFDATPNGNGGLELTYAGELATVASEPPKECICSGNQLLFGECNCGWKAAQK